MEQPFRDDRTTNPANSGMAETLIPLSMRASVTLKSAGSKASWAVTPAATARAPSEIFSKNFMAMEAKELLAHKVPGLEIRGVNFKLHVQQLKAFVRRRN
jgi:hypothetical protein